MPRQEVILTPEGYKKLQEELVQLKTVHRKEAAERVKQALEYGDITDNSEFDTAKKQQAFIEEKIRIIERELQDAKIIDPNNVRTKKITIGSTVVLKSLDFGEETRYTIVGPVETDPSNNKISYESPVGEAIMSRRKGDVVTVKTPMGKLKYKIVDIG